MPTSLRIVSLLSSATEMLYLLGLGEQVIGISHECDFPAEVARKPRVTRSNVNSSAESGAIDAEVKSLLTTGRPLYEVDARQLIELKPNLIVTQAQCDVCAVKYEDVLELVKNEPALREVQVIALNPQSLRDVLEDIQHVADITRVGDAGRREVAKLQSRIDDVQNATARFQSEDRPRVVCIEWTDPLMLAANWIPEMVDIAGGRHELTRARVHSGYSSWGDLFDYNPQVIIIMPCGFGLDRALIEGASLAQRAGWRQLDAVRNGRVVAVDANAYFNRPGPRLVETLELLAHVIHPASFNPPHISQPSAWQAIS